MWLEDIRCEGGLEEGLCSFVSFVLCQRVHPEAFHGLLPNPDKLNRTLGVDLKAYGDDHFQGVVICAIAFSISGSYPKFSDNCILLRLTIVF